MGHSYFGGQPLSWITYLRRKKAQNHEEKCSGHKRQYMCTQNEKNSKICQ